MKSFQDRIWLVLLGVAVAILVTLTTVYWNKPLGGNSGTDAGQAKPNAQRALLPKISSQVWGLFKPATKRTTK